MRLVIPRGWRSEGLGVSDVFLFFLLTVSSSLKGICRPEKCSVRVQNMLIISKSLQFLRRSRTSSSQWPRSQGACVSASGGLTSYSPKSWRLCGREWKRQVRITGIVHSTSFITAECGTSPRGKNKTKQNKKCVTVNKAESSQRSEKPFDIRHRDTEFDASPSSFQYFLTLLPISSFVIIVVV